jgi:hypothetical protein
MITANNKPNVIIQTSRTRTGTTLLVNMLYGFIIKNEPVHFLMSVDNIPRYMFDDTKTGIFKFHYPDIDEFIQKHSDKYNLYFVCSERGDKVMDKKYHDYKNVLIFNYDELLETDTYSVQDIVDNAHKKLIDFLPRDIVLNKQDAVERIQKMNILYEEISDKPFSYVEDFYQLHGSHRTNK